MHRSQPIVVRDCRLSRAEVGARDGRKLVDTGLEPHCHEQHVHGAEVSCDATVGLLDSFTSALIVSFS